MTFNSDTCGATETTSASNQPHGWTWNKTQEGVNRDTSDSDSSQIFSPHAESAAVGMEPSSQRHPGSRGLHQVEFVAPEGYVQLGLPHSRIPSAFSTGEVDDALGRSSSKEGGPNFYGLSEADASRSAVQVQDGGSVFSNADAVRAYPELTSTPASRHSLDHNSIHGDQCHSGFTAAGLESLDYLTSYPTNAGPLSSTANQDGTHPWVSHAGDARIQASLPVDQIMIDSPDVYATYYPDPVYQELHGLLHSHILETARNTGFTRQGTPNPPARETSPIRQNSSPLSDRDREAGPMQCSEMSNVSPKGTRMTVRRELELWQNYLDEVAVWVRMTRILLLRKEAVNRPHDLS